MGATGRLGALRRGCRADRGALRRGRSGVAAGLVVVVTLYILSTVLTTKLLFLTALLFGRVHRMGGLGRDLRATGRGGRRGSGFVNGVDTRVRPDLGAVSRTAGRAVSAPVLRRGVGTLGRLVATVRACVSLRRAHRRRCPLGRLGVGALYRDVVRGTGVGFGSKMRTIMGIPHMGVGAGTRRLRHVLGRLLGGTTRCAGDNGVSLRFGGQDTRARRFVLASAKAKVPIRTHRGLFGPFTRVHSLARKGKLKLPAYDLVTCGLGNALALSASCGGKAQFVLRLRMW